MMGNNHTDLKNQPGFPNDEPVKKSARHSPALPLTRPNMGIDRLAPP